MKRKFILEWHRNQFWCQGELKEFKEDKVINNWSINNHYEVDANYFCIYGTEGGTGTGFRKGELLHKIDIRDAEYTKVEL